MARIIAPNKEYAGVSAGVHFSGGEGHTDNEYLIEWFRSHGYEVIEEKTEVPEPETAEPEEQEDEDSEADESAVEVENPASEEPAAVAPAQRKGRKKEA